MAKNHRRIAESLSEDAPVIVLVRPQMAQNIGSVARAMANFAASDLRLVAPRDGWPNPDAKDMASGADIILERATLFDDTSAALHDCHTVYATTARPRDLLKPVLSPRQVAAEIFQKQVEGEKVAILFGGEQSGLDNDDVTLAHTIIEIPTNPAFSSLNLAQAVLLIGYECFLARSDNAPPERIGNPRWPAAGHDSLMQFYRRLEAELDTSGFLRPPEKRPAMVRNIRNIFQRARLRENDLSTLHGIVSALIRPRNK